MHKAWGVGGIIASGYDNSRQLKMLVQLILNQQLLNQLLYVYSKVQRIQQAVGVFICETLNMLSKIQIKRAVPYFGKYAYFLFSLRVRLEDA